MRQPLEEIVSDRNRFLLAFAGVTLLIGILILGIFFLMMQWARQTAQEALSPLTNTNNTINTRVAEMLNPTPTILADPVTIIHDVRSLARLETIQYTMEKVITAEQGQGELGFLFGDKLLFVGHGTVIAGIDLAKLQPQDLWLENNVLYARLPPAEVFVVAIDNEKSYVYDRETGLLTKGDVDLERAARIAAEQEIQTAAFEEGILTKAQENGEEYLSRLFLSLGYPEVIFVHDATPAP